MKDDNSRGWSDPVDLGTMHPQFRLGYGAAKGEAARICDALAAEFKDSVYQIAYEKAAHAIRNNKP